LRQRVNNMATGELLYSYMSFFPVKILEPVLLLYNGVRLWPYQKDFLSCRRIENVPISKPKVLDGLV
nr:hypothetical protein [Tanacetum cinerariifolium]